MDINPEATVTCNPNWDEHAGYHDTGRRGTDPETGNPIQIYTCQCGKQTMDVYGR